METLIEQLNDYTKNEYKFMLKSALLQKDADFCVLEILYKDGTIISADKKNEIVSFCLNVLPKVYKYEFKFVKNYINEDRITENFEEFMAKTFPSISYQLVSVKLEGVKFSLNVKIDESSYEHAKQKHFCETVQKYFKKMYEDYDFEAAIQEDIVYKEDEMQKLKETYVEEEVDIYAKRKIEFTNVVPLVGENFEEMASYIVDKKVPENEIVVCGKIKNIKDIVIKRKPKQVKTEDAEAASEEQKTDAEEDAAAEKIADETAVSQETTEEEKLDDKTPKYERKMYKWSMEDPTGEINCLFMSNKENQAKLEKLDKDSVIVVRGNLENDKFSGGLTLNVKDLAYCSLPEDFVEYIEWRNEKPFYEFVEPEKVVVYAQDDLMSFAETKEVCPYLKGKTFVCFDFETTGLHYENGDKIVEIGAVKIEDGKITEKFMCYVDPEKHIPAESTKITGITDEDVAGAPKDFEALQDFYKFTRGAILTGYNIINFDMRFLVGQGKSSRWNFDNATVDTYHLAQKYVHGVKNYKLGTIAEKLGVVLDNAHRAVYDAMATAEVFIKLAENIVEEPKQNETDGENAEKGEESAENS